MVISRKFKFCWYKFPIYDLFTFANDLHPKQGHKNKFDRNSRQEMFCMKAVQKNMTGKRLQWNTFQIKRLHRRVFL